jgi:hypothetical protein
MATTIMGQGNRETDRNARWSRLLPNSGARVAVVVNRKATIVIELLIKLRMSLTCSTGVYRKWNERLFKNYKSYLEDAQRRILLQTGTKVKLASDFYIIPLARSSRI